MKERELREHAECTICSRLIGQSGLPLFWTVAIKRHGLRMDVIKRQDGLIALLGGNVGIARAMGADKEMTETLIDVGLTMCELCAVDAIPLIQMVEAVLGERGIER